MGVIRIERFQTPMLRQKVKVLRDPSASQVFPQPAGVYSPKATFFPKIACNIIK
ncbi:MAG TPA: hypothetical protein PLH82_00650 [Candidatus Paceibacterota bacterium]|nr:hypothetical protein [Candidatus Paceibacterota bacterium]